MFWRKKNCVTFAARSKQCESSSVGRARPCQGRGREFESRLSLLFQATINWLLFCFK